MSSLDKQSTSSSSALTEVEEVRAKHQTMRDRLLARRQQREHLLAAAAAPRKPSAVQLDKSAPLLTNKVPAASRSHAMSKMMMSSLLTTSGISLGTGNSAVSAKLSKETDPLQNSGDNLLQRSIPIDNSVMDSCAAEPCAPDSLPTRDTEPGEDTDKLKETSDTPTPSATQIADSSNMQDNAASTLTDSSRGHRVRKQIPADKDPPEQIKRKRTNRTATPPPPSKIVAASEPEVHSIPTTTDALSTIHKSTNHPSLGDSRSPIVEVHRVEDRHQRQQRRIKDDRRQPMTNSNNIDEETVFRAELEDLLGTETAKEKESKRACKEILELLNTPTAKERYLSEKFRTQGGSQVQQFCSHGTRIDCSKARARFGDLERCTKLHFRKIIHPHTDESLGDCSFLNTCFHVDTCKYVHYTIDSSEQNHAGSSSTLSASARLHQLTGGPASISQRKCAGASASDAKDGDAEAANASERSHEAPLTLYPPQWINCDIRMLNMSVLGKFAVIMADPPWDIHMELPYGTMSDAEMRRMVIPHLQDDGYIFLWVTGRAMELGRECLRLWGYQRVDEIIWVKTNQLQRLIRTGRTGHWLNHGKEHCLVGVKGRPQGINVGLDCGVIVSEVRETSHKPDEIYGIIERLSPGTRKLELFGRPHNLQPNWITLGNQLEGTYLVDPAVVERFKKQYPNGLDTKGR